MDQSKEQGPVIQITTRTFIKIALIVAGLWLLWFIRDILAMILVAVLLASLIEPLASWLEDRNVPRGLAVIFVYTGLLVVVGGFLAFLTPVVIEQSLALLSALPAAYDALLDSLGQFQTIAAEHGLEQNVQATIQGLQNELTSSFTSLFSTARAFFGGLAAFFIILVLAFYIVAEENSVKLVFRQVAPKEYQPHLIELMNKIQRKIGAWLRGQLILGLIVGTALYIGLKLLGVEYALLLAILGGLFEIVPYIGPVLSFIPAGVLAFAQSPVTGVLTGLLYILVQQLENNILVPKVMQKTTGLNPIVSVIALVVGLKVAGVGGAILAIPLATMGAVILEDVFNHLL
jgi:predicted PurR-regulated permease PerM